MIQRPRGTRDFGPAEMARRRAVEQAMRDTCHRFGFGEVVTPTFEQSELFTLRSGEAIVDEMYVFKDKGDREMALRPEITASVIRFFVNEMSNLPKPLKLYYVGNCFRYENPQSGRYREFFQLGAELIGNENPETDAEVISLAVESLRATGLQDFNVRIGHIGILKSLVLDGIDDRPLAGNVLRMIDKADFDALAQTLETNGVPGDMIESITNIAGTKGGIEVLESVEGSKANEHLKELFEILKLQGLDDCQLDLGIVRGLDYYSGMVFEIDAPRLGAEKQVLGGGSYTLSELFGGEPVFSTGFAIGIDRVMLALEAEKELPEYAPLDAYVVPTEDAMRKYAFAIVSKMRAKGLRADVDLMRRSMSKNLKYASSMCARYAVIVGKDEMAKRSVTLRDMKSGEQTLVPADFVAEELEKLMAKKS
ncbi:MAG TPA: histidine--tRNA ligase [Thermoplasmata archaeon]|nr:histidine--tRNA ligase [Thermoplasmata archaeon]HUV60740.1 histidine--tRNA ligase [Thermoplasmata archaeon]